MRCALDLVNEAMEKRTIIEDREKKIYLENRQNKVENFCKNYVEEQLEKCAKKGEIPEASIKIVKIKGKYENIIAPIIEDIKFRYANGKPSYKADFDNAVSEKLFYEYLKSYCFTCEFTITTYRQYGFGDCEALMMTVIPNPECIR